MFSNNIVVPLERFTIEGEPKEVPVVARSGRTITNCFCGDCGELRSVNQLRIQWLMFVGTMIFRWGDSFGGREGKRIIQVGVLNDIADLSHLKPELEMFVADRVPWVPVLDVAQHEGMP
jgi:hypothetical protein